MLKVVELFVLMFMLPPLPEAVALLVTEPKRTLLPAVIVIAPPPESKLSVDMDVVVVAPDVNPPEPIAPPGLITTAVLVSVG